MKKILEKHVLTACAALSLICTFLPFYGADLNFGFFEDSVNVNVWDTLSDDFCIWIVLMIVLPIVLIVSNYILKIPQRKLILMGIPALTLLFAVVSILHVKNGSGGFGSAGIGFYLSLVTYLASIVCAFLFNNSSDKPISFSKKELASQISDLKNKGAELVKISTSDKNENKEDPQITKLKSEIESINDQLTQVYAALGEKYADYLSAGKEEELNVKEYMKTISAKKEQKEKLQKQIMEIEKTIMNDRLTAEKLDAEKKFTSDKENLDKALALEVITKEEYDIKIAEIQRRLDNFETIKKIETQAEMGLISKEEKEAKIAELLK